MDDSSLSAKDDLASSLWENYTKRRHRPKTRVLLYGKRPNKIGARLKFKYHEDKTWISPEQVVDVDDIGFLIETTTEPQISEVLKEKIKNHKEAVLRPGFWKDISDDECDYPEVVIDLVDRRAMNLTQVKDDEVKRMIVDQDVINHQHQLKLIEKKSKDCKSLATKQSEIADVMIGHLVGDLVTEHQTTRVDDKLRLSDTVEGTKQTANARSETSLFLEKILQTIDRDLRWREDEFRKSIECLLSINFLKENEFRIIRDVAVLITPCCWAYGDPLLDRTQRGYGTRLTHKEVQSYVSGLYSG